MAETTSQQWATNNRSQIPIIRQESAEFDSEMAPPTLLRRGSIENVRRDRPRNDRSKLQVQAIGTDSSADIMFHAAMTYDKMK